MPVRDHEELLAVLTSGNFDRIRGTPEAQWVEFKKEPYIFNNPKGVWEWSKDIAALANASGGLIVVGVSRTEVLSSSLMWPETTPSFPRT